MTPFQAVKRYRAGHATLVTPSVCFTGRQSEGYGPSINVVHRLFSNQPFRSHQRPGPLQSPRALTVTSDVGCHTTRGHLNGLICSSEFAVVHRCSGTWNGQDQDRHHRTRVAQHAANIFRTITVDTGFDAARKRSEEMIVVKNYNHVRRELWCSIKVASSTC
jgi:hypothetical protein